MDGNLCRDGNFVISGDPCSCKINCKECLIASTGADFCEVCTNEHYLWQGDCLIDCEEVNGTETGSGVDGRICLE